MEMTTLYDYLRLCCGPHKRRYEAMSVMLSCVNQHLVCNGFIECIAT